MSEEEERSKEFTERQTELADRMLEAVESATQPEKFVAASGIVTALGIAGIGSDKGGALIVTETLANITNILMGALQHNFPPDEVAEICAKGGLNVVFRNESDGSDQNAGE